MMLYGTDRKEEGRKREKERWEYNFHHSLFEAIQSSFCKKKEEKNREVVKREKKKLQISPDSSWNIF